MDLRVPKKLFDNEFGEWKFKDHDPKRETFTYRSSSLSCGVVVKAHQIETNFSKKERPQPKAPIIQQGKYECAAAALAMLLGESLFHTKRAMAKMQWRNDNTGANTKVSMGAARILGYDLLPVEKTDIDSNTGKCIVHLSSLNVKGMGHAVTWTGEEILDPNWDKPQRFFWGTEWAPWTLPNNGGLILLPFTLSNQERNELDLYLKKQEEESILEIKKNILLELNKS